MTSNYSRFESPEVGRAAREKLHTVHIGMGNIGFPFAKSASPYTHRMLTIDPGTVSSTDIRSGYPMNDFDKRKVESAGSIITAINPDIQYTGISLSVERRTRTRIEQATVGKGSISVINIDDPDGIKEANEILYPEMPLLSIHLIEGARIAQIVGTVPNVTPCLVCSQGKFESIPGGKADPDKCLMAVAVGMMVFWQMITHAFGNKKTRNNYFNLITRDENVLLVSLGSRDLVFDNLPSDLGPVVKRIRVRRSCNICGNNR